ncbi:lysophospholipase D GDPD1 [Caerostris extrusa]|uniref:Lysophospholipase D GDPD1 n=1 Tax=Caerostris extrusa TaxID=172846 RepID=A0AAV4MCW4_CAEEX|nr:lysophospholipase D GDPD1 [Caerostris extrusa]
MCFALFIRISVQSSRVQICWKIDLHLTKDEKVVISHDNNLLRVTGVDVNISDLNYKDLPLLKCPVNKEGDSNKEKKNSFTEEVFEKFPQVAINIDIKVNNDILISKVNELIKEYNRANITVWGNFSNDVTKKCYNLNPQIPLLFFCKKSFIACISHL